MLAPQADLLTRANKVFIHMGRDLDRLVSRADQGGVETALHMGSHMYFKSQLKPVGFT